jgi:hypothetical protein
VLCQVVVAREHAPHSLRPVPRPGAERHQWGNFDEGALAIRNADNFSEGVNLIPFNVVMPDGAGIFVPESAAFGADGRRLYVTFPVDVNGKSAGDRIYAIAMDKPTPPEAVVDHAGYPRPSPDGRSLPTFHSTTAGRTSASSRGPRGIAACSRASCGTGPPRGEAPVRVRRVVGRGSCHPPSRRPIGRHGVRVSHDRATLRGVRRVLSQPPHFLGKRRAPVTAPTCVRRRGAHGIGLIAPLAHALNERRYLPVVRCPVAWT